MSLTHSIVSHVMYQVHNVSFSFELMQVGDLEKPKPRPEGEIKLFSQNLAILVMNSVLHGA